MCFKLKNQPVAKESETGHSLVAIEVDGQTKGVVVTTEAMQDTKQSAENLVLANQDDICNQIKEGKDRLIVSSPYS